MSTQSEGSLRRVRARVDGTVQGVGYRPFVYRLAGELGITGWVLNDERGVLVEAEGPPDAVHVFLARLSADAPPLAEVRGVEAQDVPVVGEPGFEIVASVHGGAATAPVTPDSATCEDCLAELADPADRRYRYPFLNCTNCGPRFTIVRGIPYDRPLTTMAAFQMCDACQAEYEDPADRRFHAQPNACPVCGPQVTLLEADGTAVEGVEDALRTAADDLLAGRILAVKGLGGYHLACRADSEEAVATLRSRKRREDRPFALLVADVETARGLVELNTLEESLLTSRERPIVLARRLPDAAVAPSVAPHAPDLGLMLPYTPMHRLLATDTGTPLVMTSGNMSDEPIAFSDDDARERLSAIADRFVVHDRPIATRTDDSVLRVVRERPLMLRRSRGYVPASIDLPVPTSIDLLGVGAEQKNAFCVAKGDRAWPSHHIGDLKNYETLQSLETGVEHFQQLFEVAPELVVHDLHPDYLSTRYALGREDVRLFSVQHHHAHLAATLAEHGETGLAVGAIFDGTGYGTDGTVWGGEILVGGLDRIERCGRIRPIRMPGGERAIAEPWRMAASWLTEMQAPLPAAFADIAQPRWNMVARMSLNGVGSPFTSSAGRLFDAVAAMCGVRLEVTYEGQAAIEFEALADRAAVDPYPLELEHRGTAVALDVRPTILAVLGDIAAGVPVSTIAARFHAGLAQGTVEAVALVAGRQELDLAVLSGGVFQNRLLLELTTDGLEQAGLRVLVPERLPPNDGQIAFGQVAIAAARLAAG
jgi:hydrogenase maturation protein HypF